MKLKATVTSDSDSNKKYSYSSEDLSILDCYVINPLAEKVVKKFPWWLPANIITIVSSALVFLASVIAITVKSTNWPIWILIPVCYIVYLVGDAADGLQARRTKTGSPLGEFCDHFLDTFVTGQMLFIICISFRIRNPIFIGVMLYLSYFAQISAFWEKYVTHRLRLGRFSATETILSLSTFGTIGFIKPVNAFLSQQVGKFIPALGVYNVRLVDVFLCVALFCSLIVSITTLIRTKKVSLNFALYMIVGAVLTATAAFVEKDSFFHVFLTLTFYHVNYSAALLSSIIMKEKDPAPDILLTVAMCVALIFELHHPVLLTAFFLYIVIFVAIRAALFIRKNSQYWYWVNPELPENAVKPEEKAEEKSVGQDAGEKTVD